MVRRVSFVAISLAFLFFAWSGITEGSGQLSRNSTPGQTVQSLAGLGYGVFALLSLVTSVRLRRLNLLMLAGWAVTAMLAAGLAPIVWGDAPLRIGIYSGAGGLLIGLLMAWALRATAGSPAIRGH
jgi:hypothetical protein